jgi:putative transposase
MYLTQKNKIRNLSKKEYIALRELCRLSKNLYNVGIYSIRQYYLQENKYLRYESNYHICKGNENYKLLNTDIGQQVLKVVDRSFQSYFSLLKKCKNNEYRYNKVNLPHYIKEKFFSLIIQRISIKDNYFNIPMSPEFKKDYGTIRIPFPKNIDPKLVKEVRIHPKYNGRFFEVEFVYEVNKEDKELDKDNFIGIDLGIDNLCSCVTNTGSSFIIDGKKLKSINQYYNKEIARLQSIKDKQGIKGYTEKQCRITINRNNKVQDYLHKSAKLIIDYCIKNNIGNIVIGYNPEWKQNINIGRKNNQSFVSIPHINLRNKIKYRCGRYGINYIEQEESYTSKSSFFDNDPIPIFNKELKDTNFSGSRISRGQYQTKSRTVVNADINGALNILRKSNLMSLQNLQARGCVIQPLRIRIN